jgi:hypothetical protein
MYAIMLLIPNLPHLPIIISIKRIYPCPEHLHPTPNHKSTEAQNFPKPITHTTQQEKDPFHDTNPNPKSARQDKEIGKKETEKHASSAVSHS